MPSEIVNFSQAIVAHAFIPSTQEAESGGSQIWSYPGLYSKNLTQKSSIANIFMCPTEFLEHGKNNIC
jgi:hypothetical protein